MSMTRRAAVFALVTFAFSTVASANHSWANYHWARTANPVKLKIYDNLSSVWDNGKYLSTAVSQWDSGSTVLSLTLFPNTPLSSPRKCSSATGVIEVCNERYGQNGWLGIAGISISGDHITKGYTKLNDTYFEMAQYNTPAYRAFVTCQEIGHDFGLAHQDETFANANLGSCMDYTNDPDGGAGGGSSSDPANTAPNKHDYDQLASMYAHLDSTNTASLQSTLKAVTEAHLVPVVTDFDDGNEPWQWGTPVGFDGHGRANKFRIEFPSGEVRFTHVLWVPDLNRGNSVNARD